MPTDRLVLDKYGYVGYNGYTKGEKMKATTTVRIDLPNKYERVMLGTLTPRERLELLVLGAEKKVRQEEKDRKGAV